MPVDTTQPWEFSHHNACNFCTRGNDEREMNRTEVNADEVCEKCFAEIAAENAPHVCDCSCGCMVDTEAAICSLCETNWHAINAAATIQAVFDAACKI